MNKKASLLQFGVIFGIILDFLIEIDPKGLILALY